MCERPVRPLVPVAAFVRSAQTLESIGAGHAAAGADLLLRGCEPAPGGPPPRAAVVLTYWYAWSRGGRVVNNLPLNSFLY
jgi:hypothetical protein